MNVAPPHDESTPSRELIRTLRGGMTRFEDRMPESAAWQAWIHLARRAEPEANALFISALRSLHSRRSIAGSSLSTLDPHTEEHRLAGDPMIGELWKAYKKCIRNHRTGPASEILKEIEIRL
jgi:hypothetical protein